MITKFEHGGDQVDSNGGAELHRVVQRRLVNIANEKPKFSAQARMTKKPKMTFSRFMQGVSGDGDRRCLTADAGPFTWSIPRCAPPRRVIPRFWQAALMKGNRQLPVRMTTGSFPTATFPIWDRLP